MGQHRSGTRPRLSRLRKLCAGDRGEPALCVPNLGLQRVPPGMVRVVQRRRLRESAQRGQGSIDRRAGRAASIERLPVRAGPHDDPSGARKVGRCCREPRPCSHQRHIASMPVCPTHFRSDSGCFTAVFAAPKQTHLQVRRHKMYYRAQLGGGSSPPQNCSASRHPSPAWPASAPARAQAPCRRAAEITRASAPLRGRAPNAAAADEDPQLDDRART